MSMSWRAEPAWDGSAWELEVAPAVFQWDSSCSLLYVRTKYRTTVCLPHAHILTCRFVYARLYLHPSLCAQLCVCVLMNTTAVYLMPGERGRPEKYHTHDSSGLRKAREPTAQLSLRPSPYRGPFPVLMDEQTVARVQHRCWGEAGSPGTPSPRLAGGH